MTQNAPSQADIDRLRSDLETLLGPSHVIGDTADLAPYLAEQRGRYQGVAPFAIRPGTAEEVAAAVRLCAAANVAIVPQGGNTGLVGGSIPLAGDGAIVLSLQRLNRIREVDPVDYSMTVEAGCVLESVQRAAAEVDRLFPLSLGAEGSCQIGGNISTNAGGIHVLRYGNMRDLILGLEVVLPDGRLWNGLKTLRKDNTGYALTQLFAGAEGTLGIITAATLKLFARPREQVTAFIAVRDPQAAVELLARTRLASGETVTAFELIPGIALDFLARHHPEITDPLATRHAWYVLTESSAGSAATGLKDAIEAMLSEAFEDGLVQDATIAASQAQAAGFWRIREAMVEVQGREGASIKHDISVPVSRIPQFLAKALPAVEDLVPGIRPYPFGHLGDGNLHFNLSQPVNGDAQAFLGRWEEVNRCVHEIAVGLGGSFSAEHGLGRMKVEENEHFKSHIEIELLRRIKSTLDPNGLMNPGKVVRP